MSKLKLIVCTAENNLIGDKKPTGNGLLWHSKEELQYYKESTIGNVVLFGKVTASCVPLELMKKNRDVIVLDRTTDISKLIKNYENTGKDIFICGGATIYKYFLENFNIDELLISKLKPHVKVEKANEPVYFPDVTKFGYKLKSVDTTHEDFDVYVYTK